MYNDDKTRQRVTIFQITPSGFSEVTDDLVFSGAGSGCNNEDDEDECPPLPEAGSGDDDLITPIYIPTTRSPHTLKPSHKNKPETGGKPCDDEDCFPGSGSGEITVEDAATTVQETGTDKTLIEARKILYFEHLMPIKGGISE